MTPRASASTRARPHTAVRQSGPARYTTYRPTPYLRPDDLAHPADDQ
ncbi:hypothetical protein [Streptomyces sp. NPDC046862]